MSSPQSQYGQTGLTTRTTRGRGVSTIAVWSNGSYDPDDTRAGRLHNRSMVKRVLRPGRHEGGASPQSQYGQTGLTTRTTRGRGVSIIAVWSNGSNDPNDTRAGRLHNHSIIPAGEAPASPRTVCQFEPYGSDDTRACRLHNRSIFPAGEAPASPTTHGQTGLTTRTTRGRGVSIITASFPNLREGMQYRLHGVISRGRDTCVPNLMF